MQGFSVEWHSSLEHRYIVLSGTLYEDVELLSKSDSFRQFSQADVKCGFQVIYYQDGVWFPGYFAETMQKGKQVLIQRCYGKRYDKLTKVHFMNVNKVTRCPVACVMVLSSDIQGASSVDYCVQSSLFQPLSCEPPVETQVGVCEMQLSEPEVLEVHEVHEIPTEPQQIPPRSSEALIPLPLPRDASASSSQGTEVGLMWKDNGYLLHVMRDMLRTGLTMSSRDEFKAWLYHTYIQPSRNPDVHPMFRLPPFQNSDEAIEFCERYCLLHPNELTAAWMQHNNGNFMAASYTRCD